MSQLSSWRTKERRRGLHELLDDVGQHRHTETVVLLESQSLVERLHRISQAVLQSLHEAYASQRRRVLRRQNQSLKPLGCIKWDLWYENNEKYT